MGKTWPAVLACSLALLLSAGFLFFTVAGPVYIADWLADAAAQLEPKWGEKLYRLSLQANPLDDQVRVRLAELYCAQQSPIAAEQLLRESIAEGTAGTAVYLHLAALYTQAGQLSDACTLLDQVPEGYVSGRVYQARPKVPEVPRETQLSEDSPLRFSAGENRLWYRMDGGSWMEYQSPLSPAVGEHRFSLLAISPEGIPSPMLEYHCTVMQTQTVGWTGRVFSTTGRK